MATGLNLLMRDGTLHVVFDPTLDAGEYDELMSAIHDPDTIVELREVLLELAYRWKKQVEFDTLEPIGIVRQPAGCLAKGERLA